MAPVQAVRLPELANSGSSGEGRGTDENVHADQYFRIDLYRSHVDLYKPKIRHLRSGGTTGVSEFCKEATRPTSEGAKLIRNVGALSVVRSFGSLLNKSAPARRARYRPHLVSRQL